MNQIKRIFMSDIEEPKMRKRKVWEINPLAIEKRLNTLSLDPEYEMSVHQRLTQSALSFKMVPDPFRRPKHKLDYMRRSVVIPEGK